MYRSLPKIRPPPFLHTNFGAKVGRGICLNIQFVSLPSSLAIFNMCEVDYQDDCRSFLEERQF